MREAVIVSPTLQERYWSKVDRRGPNECWPWTGCTSTGSKGRAGYGLINTGKSATGRPVTEIASRVAWRLAHGEAAGDLHVRHRCDNPLCQNPEHLELGTHTDNMRDMHERGRAVQVRGEQIIQSKLTEKEVREIVEMRNNGSTLCAIAAQYGVAYTTVQSILLGKSWTHITGLPRVNRLPRVPWRRVNRQGSRNNSAKLNEAAVREIFAMRAAGRTQREIAEAHGVGQTAVSRILTGKRWAHLQVDTG